MKMSVPTISLGVLIGGLLYLAPNYAPLPSDIPTTAPAMPLHRGAIPPGLSPRALLGAPVTTPDGTYLGFVDDLVLQLPDGYITLVIVAEARKFGLGGRFVALPWGLVQPTADGTALTITLPPAASQHPTLEEAPEPSSPGDHRM